MTVAAAMLWLALVSEPVPLPRPAPYREPLVPAPIEQIVPMPQLPEPPEESTMIQLIKEVIAGLSIAEIGLIGCLCYFVYRDGLPAVVAKIKNIKTKADADLATLKATVATDLPAVKADIEKLKAAVWPTKQPGA